VKACGLSKNAREKKNRSGSGLDISTNLRGRHGCIVTRADREEGRAKRTDPHAEPAQGWAQRETGKKEKTTLIALGCEKKNAERLERYQSKPGRFALRGQMNDSDGHSVNALPTLSA